MTPQPDRSHLAHALRRMAAPCLALSLLPAAALMAAAAAPTLVRSVNASGTEVLLAFLGLPLWLCLLVAFAGATTRGAFDWLAQRRAVQHGLVASAVTALCYLCCRSAALQQSAPAMGDWLAQPVLAWAVFVLPALALLAGLIALCGPLRRALPAACLRLPTVGAGGLSLLMVAAVLGQQVPA